MVPDAALKTMEILLVEEGLLDARAIIQACRECGIKHRLTLVRTVMEAIDFLRRQGVFARAPRPDVVLLDTKFADGSSQDVLQAVRAQPNTASIPIVQLHQSCSDCQLVAGSNDCVCDGELAKPVDPRELQQILQRHQAPYCRLRTLGVQTLAR